MCNDLHLQESLRLWDDAKLGGYLPSVVEGSRRASSKKPSAHSSVPPSIEISCLSELETTFLAGIPASTKVKAKATVAMLRPLWEHGRESCATSVSRAYVTITLIQIQLSWQTVHTGPCPPIPAAQLITACMESKSPFQSSQKTRTSAVSALNHHTLTWRSLVIELFWTSSHWCGGKTKPGCNVSLKLLKIRTYYSYRLT